MGETKAKETRWGNWLHFVQKGLDNGQALIVPPLYKVKIRSKKQYAKKCKPT